VKNVLLNVMRASLVQGLDKKCLQCGTLLLRSDNITGTTSDLRVLLGSNPGPSGVNHHHY